MKLDFLKDENIRTMARNGWDIGWPMTFIMLYEFLIGIADVYVAGRFGKEAQAAYGFAFQLYFIFIILGIAISIGSVSIISRLFTSERTEEFRTAVSSSVITASAAGMIFVVLGVFFSHYVISAATLPAEIKKLAIPFLKIYSLGFMFDYMLMNNNGIMRACGMVKKSLWIMTIVCVMNIILNFALAFKTPLGLDGIAVATVISVLTGAVMSMYYTGRLSAAFRFSSRIIREVLDISWPYGLLQAFVQLGYLALFLMLGMLPRYNTEIIAALTNGLKIESALFMPAIAFNLGAAVLVGNLLGKKDEEGAFASGIITAVMGVTIVLVMTAFVMLNARHIASFLSDNPIVIKESTKYIYIALISEPFFAWGLILGGGIIGAGDTKSVMLITFISVWLIRIPLCYFSVVHFGFNAVTIWWAMNISVFVQAILMTRRYWGRKWMATANNISHLIPKL